MKSVPRIVTSPNTIRVNVGKHPRRYDIAPQEFEGFRYKDIGRPGHTRLLLVQLPSKNWVKYGYSFSRRDVSWDQSTRTLTATDATAYETLKELKERGELKTIKIKRGRR